MHKYVSRLLGFVSETDVCFWRDSSKWDRASLFTRFLDHTQRVTTVGESFGRVIISSRRPLADNIQHSQHSAGGILPHDLSRRAATDLRLRPRGHWDWHQKQTPQGNYVG